jgi:DNA polymerase III subunit beta
MKFSASRENILKPLQAVIGVVERKQTMPILSNVLLSLTDNRLSITGTDLEVELVADADVTVATPGEVTVPGRKLYDICRALPDTSTIEFAVTGDRMNVKTGRSRFTLSTLKAADFPTIDDIASQHTIEVAQPDLHTLLQKTLFSMAQQDVRYYLNGLLLETAGEQLRAVATDGHRLALAEIPLSKKVSREEQVILPRKGVLELNRLLDGDEELTVTLGANHVRVEKPGIRLTSKLIDGRFPDYQRVIPKDPANLLTADRELLRHALQRTAILSNEKYRGVRLEVSENTMTIQANNPEQEEAVETLEVEYGGEALEIAFNVNYLLDALAAIESATVVIGMTDGNSSCLITAPGEQSTQYVVMPMRL